MASGRERLQELRAAARGGPTSPQAAQYEMQQVETGPLHPPSGNDISQFYDEIGALRDALGSLEANISRIGDLHNISASSTDPSSAQSSVAELEHQTTRIRGIINDVKKRIQSLQQQNKMGTPAYKSQKSQIDTIKNQFKEILTRYQRIEKDSQTAYRKRMARQFKIVKPDATEIEVQQVLSGGPSDQIFSQALMDSDRYGESRAAYREVQTRHEEIQSIERTLEELAQLFNDLALFVEKDQDNLNELENLATAVDDDMRQGLEQTEKAVKSAKAARRKKIWFFWIAVVIILIILGIVLGVVLGNK